MNESKALRLRATRQAQGKSLSELAQETGLDKGTLSRIERGDLRPNVPHLLAIGKALGLKELVAAIERVYP